MPLRLQGTVQHPAVAGVFFGQQQRELQKLFQPVRRLRGEKAFGGGEHDRLAHLQNLDKAGIGQRLVRQIDQIQRVVLQHLQQQRRGVGHNAQLHGGAALVVAAQQLRHDGGAKAVDGADAQRAGKLGLLLQILLCKAQVVQDADGVGVEPLPAVGQVDPLADAVEQDDPQLLFELLHLDGNGSL